MNSGHTARHRAERATLTEVIRAAAHEAPKGAGRSAVVVATVGGIALSAFAPPASADSLDADDLTSESANQLELDAPVEDLLKEDAPVEDVPVEDVQVSEDPETDARDALEALTETARTALEAAPTVVVAEDVRIDVERVGEDGEAIAVVEVTAKPRPRPRPAPRPAAAASRTAQRGADQAATSAPAADSSRGGQIVSLARRYLGTPYVFGGASPAGFDCSGLVVYVHRQLGISLPHQSTRIRDAGNTVRIPRSEARPGDIIWSPGHVSIYIGGGRQIEATRPGGHTVREAGIWQSNPMFLRVTG